jgi:hypothetical protein
MGSVPCELLPMQCQVASTLPPMPPGNPHGVYQQTVVAEELLDEHEGITYKATQHPGGQLTCPVTGCQGVAKDGWNMRRHFQDLHPWNCSKGRAELPVVSILPDTSESISYRALEDRKLHIGDRYKNTAQSGSDLSTRPPLHLLGAWGHFRKSQGVQISWTPPSSGRQ